MVTIYTTPTCSKCKILKKKMDEKKIDYTEIQGIDVMQSLGFTEVPMVKMGDRYINFREANEWVNKYNKDKE
jgi:glutaredoxin